MVFLKKISISIESFFAVSLFARSIHCFDSSFRFSDDGQIFRRKGTAQPKILKDKKIVAVVL